MRADRQQPRRADEILSATVLFHHLAKFNVVDDIHGNRRVTAEAAIERSIDQIEGADANIRKWPPSASEMHLLTDRKCESITFHNFAVASSCPVLTPGSSIKSVLGKIDDV